MKWLVVTLLSSMVAVSILKPSANKHSGRCFMGFAEFGSFERIPGPSEGDNVFISPVVDPEISWNELVVSWNAAQETALTVEAKAIYPERETKWYVMGMWSADPGKYPRESVTKQKDSDGDVETDTLVVKRPSGKVRIRITVNSRAEKPIKFLGLSFTDTTSKPEPGKPYRRAWTKDLNVPERSQLAYADGLGWCSPTSTCMVLNYWAEKLKRPELARDVTEVAAGVNDPNWPGTGNWPFNTAYCSTFPGIRAYVTRLADLSELEQWIAAGIPVVCSVSYRLLHDAGKSDGHVVVCTGFTKDGKVIINDPWCHPEKGERPRCVVPRENMVRAWAVSKNTVYLIYPENVKPPRNSRGHWAE